MIAKNLIKDYLGASETIAMKSKKHSPVIYGTIYGRPMVTENNLQFFPFKEKPIAVALYFLKLFLEFFVTCSSNSFQLSTHCVRQSN